MATAGASSAWLLLEHPGPWPRDAVPNALGASLARELQQHAPSVRVILIRRPSRRSTEHPLCVLAWTAGTQPWMRQARIGHYEDVLDIDLAALEAGHHVEFGERRDEPLLTVCTHGKRDACCAEFGRPVLRALADFEPWECSHIGGDRFAANLVCFPHGLYYGHLNPITALAAVNAYHDGRVFPRNLRGRSGLAQACQAAEHFVRQETGLDAITAVAASGAPIPAGEGQVDVDVDAGGDRYRVRLQRAPHGRPVPTGCGDDELVQRDTWALISAACLH